MGKLEAHSLKEELEGLPLTKYDIMLENKDENIEKVRAMLKSKPATTRREICAKLNISMRSATRYLTALREDGVKVITAGDTQVELAKARTQKLKDFVSKHPQTTKAERCRAVGISEPTYIRYMRAIHKGA
jgi:predicted transcriptional regulator